MVFFLKTPRCSRCEYCRHVLIRTELPCTVKSRSSDDKGSYGPTPLRTGPSERFETLGARGLKALLPSRRVHAWTWRAPVPTPLGQWNPPLPHPFSWRYRFSSCVHWLINAAVHYLSLAFQTKTSYQQFRMLTFHTIRFFPMFLKWFILYEYNL